jgi:hypothetical protein
LPQLVLSWCEREETAFLDLYFLDKDVFDSRLKSLEGVPGQSILLYPAGFSMSKVFS